jgi:hypothetical protein
MILTTYYSLHFRSDPFHVLRFIYTYTWNEELNMNELSNSMEQRPSWEDNNLSVSQEIPWLLWNPNLQ